jgi:hypothetical protein
MCFVRGPVLPTPTHAGTNTKSFYQVEQTSDAYRHVAVRLCKTPRGGNSIDEIISNLASGLFFSADCNFLSGLAFDGGSMAEGAGVDFQSHCFVNEWKSRRRCRQTEVVNTLIPPVASERLLVDLRRVAFFFVCLRRDSEAEWQRNIHEKI